MLFARSYLTVDPAWPWSLPGIGVWGLLGAAGVLAGLTLWTYLGVRGVSWRRLAIVLALRLSALAVTVLVMLRPSLATEEEASVSASKIIFVIDLSKSMTITDEFNNLARIDNVRRLLTSSAVLQQLKRLGVEQKVEFVYYQGSEQLKPYAPDSPADGKQTRIGQWLNEVLQRHAGDTNVRGLLLFSDGVQTSNLISASEEAKRFAGKNWPIYPFALGQPTTSMKERDVLVEKVSVEPPLVYAKTKMTVQALVHAPDYEGTQAQVSVWLEDPATKTMKPILKFDNHKAVQGKVGVTLPRSRDNLLSFECQAPETPGEYKVTVKIDPLTGETNLTNNEASTWFDVTKEGVSILWVEGRKRAFEPTFAIRTALGKEKRFRVHYLEKTGTEPAADLGLDKTHYDVIVLGDISATRFTGGDPTVLRKVRELVTKNGVGLLMLGGYETFGNKDWHLPESLLADFFPVRFRPGQIEEKIALEPTPEGLEYLLKLDDNPQKNEQLWSKYLEPLEGMTTPGELEPRARAYLRRKGTGEPILAGIDQGQGRVMTFSGDTTWQSWRRHPEAIPAYETFWRKLMLWLAKQENTDSDLSVTLATRRLEIGRRERLDFDVRLRGKGGAPLKQVEYTGKVVGPSGQEFPVTIASDERGFFANPPGPGEYRLEVTGKGKDISGRDIQGTKSARFLVEEQDIELTRPAADPDFLDNLARLSGGKLSRPEEKRLQQVLDEIAKPQNQGPPRVTTWPDWTRAPLSTRAGDQVSALWHSWSLGCLMLFVTLLCVEWYLRRKWGLV